MAETVRPLPVLLMGEQRSGTTILAQVLNQHPDATVRIGCLSRVLDSAYRWGLGPDEVLSARQRHVLARDLQSPWALVVKEPPLQLETSEFDSLRGLLRVAFERSAPESRVSCHKVHGPAGMLHGLLSIESLRIVYIVRDVRDVILSRWYRGEDLLDPPILRWREAVDMVCRLRGHDRLHVLRFEDLVIRPDVELARIRRFLGVAPNWGDVDLAPACFNTSFGDLRVPLDERAAFRWRGYSEEAPLKYAGWLCRRHLESLGYDADAARSLAWAQRPRFAQRAIKAQALRVASRVKVRLQRVLLPAWD